MAFATLGGLKSSPKAIPAPLTFVASRLGRVAHLEALCHRSPLRTVRLGLLNRTPSSLVIFRGRRVLPGPVRTDSTGSRRLAVVGKLGADECFRAPGVPPPSGVGADECFRAPGLGADQTPFLWRTRPIIVCCYR